MKYLKILCLMTILGLFIYNYSFSETEVFGGGTSATITNNVYIISYNCTCPTTKYDCFRIVYL